MSKSKKNQKIFLSTYLLHKDNRIRLPKIIENNMGVIAGETYFDVYFDVKNQELILKKSVQSMVNEKDED